MGVAQSSHLFSKPCEKDCATKVLTYLLKLCALQSQMTPCSELLTMRAPALNLITPYFVKSDKIKNFVKASIDDKSHFVQLKNFFCTE